LIVASFQGEWNVLILAVQISKPAAKAVAARKPWQGRQSIARGASPWISEKSTKAPEGRHFEARKVSPLQGYGFHSHFPGACTPGYSLLPRPGLRTFWSNLLNWMDRIVWLLLVGRGSSSISSDDFSRINAGFPN
jgi:hypothetical protein